jgi:tetratricopeptide (TPR) repeat protein
MEEQAKESEALVLETKEQSFENPSENPPTDKRDETETPVSNTVELSWESEETPEGISDPVKIEEKKDLAPTSSEPSSELKIKETQEKRKSAPKARKSENVKTAMRKRSKETTQPKNETEEIATPVPEQIVKSKGIAYLQGNTIRLAGGTKLLYGDEITIGGKDYTLKPSQQKQKALWFAGAAFSLLLIVALFFSFSGTAKDSGKILGVVYDPTIGKFISNAEIKIDQLNQKIKTNDLGYFMFEGLPVGSYTLKTNSPGYPEGKDYATITPKQTTTVTIFLQTPSSSNKIEQNRLSNNEKSSPPEENRSREPKAMAEGNYGSLRVETNVPGASVYLDNELAGITGSVVNNIPLGNHTLRVSKNGFEDYTASLTIKSRSITRVNAYLTESKKQGAEELFNAGMTEFQNGRYSQAVDAFTSALKEKPTYPEALFNRGKAYVFLNNSSQSLEDFSKAAKYFVEKGDLNKALDCYTQLINLQPADLNSYYSRGQIFLLTNDFDKAIADFSKTTQIDSKFFSGHIGLGQSYYKKGLYKESIDALKTAQKLNPNNKQVYALLAKSNWAKGNKSAAKDNYKKFSELSSFTDRENMKKDPEWRKLLDGLGIKDELELP